MSREMVFSFLDAHRDRDAERIKSLCHPDIRVYGPGWEISGVEHYLEGQLSIWKEIPEQKIAIEDVVGDGKKIAVQWMDRAEHPSNGGTVDVITSGCSIFTLDDKVVLEIAQYSDSLDVIRQLKDD